MKNYIDENRVELCKHLDYISEFMVNDYYDELREKIENVAIDEGVIDDNWNNNDVNKLIIDVIKMMGEKLQKI